MMDDLKSLIARERLTVRVEGAEGAHYKECEMSRVPPPTVYRDCCVCFSVDHRCSRIEKLLDEIEALERRGGGGLFKRIRNWISGN